MTTGDPAPTGVQKVAAFLLSLDREVASQVLGHMPPDVLAEVAEAMTRLDEGLRGPERVKEIWKEIAVLIHAPKSLRPSEEGELSGMLESSVGAQRATEVLAAIRDRRLRERPFLNIERHPPESLARVLVGESPAVAALVLAHLDPSASAAVLGSFDADRALDVVRRMATLSPPGYETLRGIAEKLEGRLEELAGLPVPADASRRLKTIADMLNFADDDIERSVLHGLSDKDEDIAKEIREFMFTWEDIGEIDKRAMQKILGSVDTRTLAMSLKAASSAVESNVMANLSARVREMVAEERELAGSVSMAEVLAARNEIMTTVRTMMDSGEFKPSKAGDELVS